MIKHYILSCALLCATLVNANSISYTKNDIHAFLPKNGEITLNLGYELVNDTVDVLNIKESEFGGSSQNIDSLGDMQGFEMGIGYSFKDDFYLSASFNQKHLQYSGSTLVNTNVDLFLRYQVYENDTLSVAVDGGYEYNRAKDLQMRDIDVINSNLNKIAPDNHAEISPDGDTLTYTDSSGTRTSPLTLDPYASLENAKDEAFYFRAISSFKTKTILFDLFAGYKQIKIDYTIDSSLAHEASLQTELEQNNFGTITNSREDGMLFAGFAFRHQLGSLYSTFAYKYNSMQRIECLEETNSNHLVDVNLFYSLTPKFALYVGAHAMTNQFNGEINYLYTRYTKTTFDHPYGYVNVGTVIKF